MSQMFHLLETGTVSEPEPASVEMPLMLGLLCSGGALGAVTTLVMTDSVLHAIAGYSAGGIIAGLLALVGAAWSRRS